jgi:predicted TIM-barrel fold metal-dependent hydrolase
MAAFFGSGLLDRYPNMNYVILESGFGWIPFWAIRMEDQAEYMGFVAEGLQHTMWEYATSGRFYASIVLHEGPKMVKLVSEMMGDILMFSTDYPHPETRFPGSVDLALSWKDTIDDNLMRKILWDNAVKCFGEP